MLNYNPNCHYVDSVGYTYSCDKIRISFTVREDCLCDIQRLFNNPKRLDIEVSAPSTKDFTYRYFMTVSNQQGEKAVFGFGFNGTNREDSLKGFIEFNPNKIDYVQKMTIDTVCGLCHSVEVTRCDVAIDIPMNRRLCHLVKDNRHYTKETSSLDNTTEYLGRRNTVGRVKVYNKKLESNLDYELTRLEITTEPNIALFRAHLPKVRVDVENFQNELNMALYELKPNTRALVEALKLLEYDNKLECMAFLDRRSRKQIEPFVFGDTKELSLDLECVSRVLEYAKSYEL